MEIAATWMRGGTSKCWVFRAEDLPAGRAAIGRILAASFGSRDRLQIDGVGGATSVTSKALVIGPCEHWYDADYLFAQVGIGDPTVEFDSNCGNCATAAALWVAEQKGPAETDTAVRLHNLNTDTVLEANVATRGAVEVLDTVVPGVEGRGVSVELAFVDPEGGNTGSLWPTGRPLDQVEVEGRTWPLSMVDAGAPVALTTAEALGVEPGVSVPDFDTHVPLLRQLRRAAALRMGLSRPEDPILDSVPKIGIAGRPVDYTTSDGHEISADDYDLSVRMLSMLATHPALGLTSAVALTLMSQDPDSVVGQFLKKDPSEGLVMGTPGGLIRTRLERSEGHTKVFLQRAARRLAETTLYVPDYQLTELP